MGQEIDNICFKESDFVTFQARLRDETALLIQWCNEKIFASEHYVCGFELEAWLVDQQFRAAPCNDEYIQRTKNPYVTPELAKFNVELNGNPQSLQGAALSTMHNELDRTWRDCNRIAAELNIQLLMIGILPTLSDTELTITNMSNLNRYWALNEQVLKQRKGKPLTLNILGNEHLQTTHWDVMLEAAATSFQIHLQVPMEHVVRYYNAAQILAGPMVAVSANSPFLFGKDLWDETRIPLFEQAIEVGGYEGAAFGPLRRVTFGSGYMRASMAECFIENRDHYPVLLPILYDTKPEALNHLRLHNGTIWRWNRPLIGWDEDRLAQPHVRIEHRVVPGGPTVGDEIANMALFYGAVHHLATRPEAPELQLPFSQARDNFYAAAKNGFNAQLMWLNGRKMTAQTLLRDELLAMARQGLNDLDVDPGDIALYLGIIAARIDKARNGAAWQRAFVVKYGHDMQQLTAAYAQHQQSGIPVHDWDL